MDNLSIRLIPCVDNILIKSSYNYNIFKLLFYRSCELMIVNPNILLWLQLYIIIIFRFFPHLNCYNCNFIILNYNSQYFLYKYLFYTTWVLYCFSNTSKTLKILCLVLNIILNYIFFIYFILFIHIMPYIMYLVLIASICSTQKSNLIYFTKIYCGG